MPHVFCVGGILASKFINAREGRVLSVGEQAKGNVWGLGKIMLEVWHKV